MPPGDHRRPIEVKVLYTQGCPALQGTIELIEKTALETGVSIELDKVVVASIEQARELKFLGSPTVHVDGLDIDPLALDSNSYGLA